mmetsp:Transcript_14968/g.21902  ORF Transcript_14968/g.21902 Transcript_14968/m.21902 type:complete len:306 (+) Transcript_14968:97-1014(+)|eukprot:CAMPEP_0197237870 /NCGR_PEP_ID=MMETSP1429-20130617/4577_1 /TAXON_ID=49237 /ORGANISM="Chaetoceros  sp., Strain UNC1202" /LENGTH=305 /DNA_ID=CAMNT_0042696951 /DNA_START=72 /DNA_END=989 /DNA_ORIENTATION=+
MVNISHPSSIHVRVPSKKIQQHVVVARRKVTALVAFTTTILLLCIENVKAFTAPLSSSAILNENTLLFLASGAHSVAKRWKAKTATKGISFHPSRSRLSISNLIKPSVSMSMTMSKLSSYCGVPTTCSTMNSSNAHCVTRSPHSISNTNSNSLLKTVRSTNNAKAAFAPQLPSPRGRTQSLEPLRMAFGFGAAPSPSAPPMLDMKTSLNAFGSWYNHMDPVAGPPVYDDDVMDYSFSNPADSWPSTYEDDAVTTTNLQSFSRSSNVASKMAKRPHPIRTIRKIAGWVLGSTPARHARGFGTQNFL